MAEDSNRSEDKQFLYRNEKGDGLNTEGILQARQAMIEGIESLIKELAEMYGVAPKTLQNAVVGISVPTLPPDLPAPLRLAIASRSNCHDSQKDGSGRGRVKKPFRLM